jgi:murein DD-endopeptidase MepM/ murein hydrolase activator NlpD
MAAFLPLLLLGFALAALARPASSPASRAQPSRLSWIVPVRGPVTSPYGVRRGRMHQGADIQAPRSAPVVAVAPGLVVAVSPDGERENYGNTVIVRHYDGTATVYAHLESFNHRHAWPGNRVNAGDQLGTIGTTQAPLPPGEHPHLHFEVLAELVTDRNARPVLNRDTPRRIDPQQWHGPRAV